MLAPQTGCGPDPVCAGEVALMASQAVHLCRATLAGRRPPMQRDNQRLRRLPQAQQP
ncbi:hypothetical protein [Glaciimonas sp. PAMC28666]|uniref:hypothetical protein n=1 Tax=Glaciimonas sp. PAMC28666 TaxID=2807626 RepID=UPI00196269E9|nr:hypothetical protein [Glaciimonas sp. PAMC28666]QRX83700.1 hypothetical protein JQN73_05595 [Glaciimonas sp. PAMC28666]